MTAPCPKCPFRKDIPAYLSDKRVAGICEAIIERQEYFQCHQTVEFGEDGNPPAAVGSPKAQHCAGALIFLEKLERPNQLMRIAERMGVYDRAGLKMTSPIFDSVADFVAAQRRKEPV